MARPRASRDLLVEHWSVPGSALTVTFFKRPGDVQPDTKEQPVPPSGGRAPDKLIGVEEVKKRTGLSRATIYRQERAGKFPCRIAASKNRVAWYESEINAWIAARRVS